MTEGETFVRCYYCGDAMGQIAINHLKKHGMDTKDYREYCKEHNYPIDFMCDEVSRQIGDSQQIERDLVIRDLKNAAEKCEGFLTIEKYDELGEYSPRPVFKHFSTWNEALREIGVSPKKNADKDELVKDLKESKKKVDGILTRREYNKHGKYCAATIFNRFGEWNNALREAGLKPHYDATKEEVLEDLKRVSQEQEEPVRMVEYNKEGKYSAKTLRKKCGSFNKAKKELGLELVSHIGSKKGHGKGTTLITEDDIIEDLQKVAEEIQPLTYKEYEKHGKYAPNTAKRYFGSWNGAKKAAGLKVITSSGHKPPTRERLKEDLRRVKEKLGRPPKQPEYTEHGKFGVSSVQKFFGGWNNAKKELDFLQREVRTEDVSEEAILESLKDAAEKTDGLLTYDKYVECEVYNYGSSTIQRYIGSFDEAKREAGLETLTWTEEELINEIKQADKEVDGGLTIEKFNEISSTTPNTITKWFGSWTKAREKAGVDASDNHFKWSEQKVTEALDRAIQEIDGEPTLAKLRELDYTPSSTTIEKHLGKNWNEVKKEKYCNKQVRWSKEDIISKIREVNDEVEGSVTWRDFFGRDDTPSKSPVMDNFGSFTDAREKALEERGVNN
jgi:hypothetical protein